MKRKTGLIFLGSIGPQDFVNCEDFVLSDEPGIAYVTCDPILTYYNKVMGTNRLTPGQPIENGAVWRVRYDEVRKKYRFLLTITCIVFFYRHRWILKNSR